MSDPTDTTIPAQRTALVTGASSGIGLSFCHRLARDGYRLVLVARRAERLEAIAKQLEQEHGIETEVFPADLVRKEELGSVEALLASEPTLDLLVNNAGFGTTGPLASLDPDGEDSEIRLNVLALVRLTRAVLPGMIERGHGGIVNVSSMAGFSAGPYMATYAATKAFVNAFTEGVHEELRGTGVKIQALCPGFTRTEFQEVAGVGENPLPDFVWQEPDEVVEASLAGLESGSLIVVPGLANQALATVGSAVPRGIMRRVLGTVMGRMLADSRVSAEASADDPRTDLKD
ncbi:MAG: SDR family oxidoreductase [Myxococcales bacterium]|nr:SDR family oxidoreductase [Myxococcales bacterium]